MLLHEDLTKSIIGAFYAVYDKLGYGFLEKVYSGALTLELRRRGHRVAFNVSVPVYYDGVEVARYNTDHIIDDLVVLELKSTAKLCRADHQQLSNYLRCTELDVGLLLHFGPQPKFYRFISTFPVKRWSSAP